MIETEVLLPQTIGDLSRFILSCLGSLILLLLKTFKWFGFPIFRFERALCRLFQKRAVRTKIDVYVLINACQLSPELLFTAN